MKKIFFLLVLIFVFVLGTCTFAKTSEKAKPKPIKLPDGFMDSFIKCQPFSQQETYEENDKNVVFITKIVGYKNDRCVVEEISYPENFPYTMSDTVCKYPDSVRREIITEIRNQRMLSSTSRKFKPVEEMAIMKRLGNSSGSCKSSSPR